MAVVVMEFDKNEEIASAFDKARTTYPEWTNLIIVSDTTEFHPNHVASAVHGIVNGLLKTIHDIP